MLDAVNTVQLVGESWETNEWGEDNAPENLATALQDYIMNVSVNEVRWLSSQEKSDVLQYIYDNRPYANREAIIEARGQWAIIVQNMKYVNTYGIFATSTDAEEVANTISSAYGNNIYNRISSAPWLPNAWWASTHTFYEFVSTASKLAMWQYIIDNREEFMEEYEPNWWYNNGATEEEWYWIAHAATNAIIDRTEQLFTMINQSTSAWSISQRWSSIWEEWVMIYPLSSYLLSYATNALSYGWYSLQERQFILDYVFANKPYSSLWEIQSASEQWSPQ